MKYKQLLDEIGMSAPAIFAGIAGGSVIVMKYRDISLRRAMAIVVASGVAAGYLTPLVIHETGMNEKLMGAIGFCIGLLFILLLDVVIAYIKYFSLHPKEMLGILISIIPFRKTKTQNEETFMDDNDSVTEFDGGPESDQQWQP